MNCNRYREDLVEVASGSPATPDVEAHVSACAACAKELEGLRQTMALMDEWQAPEPTPYFDVRLQARLREERTRPRSWFEWIRKPAFGIAAALLLTGAVALFEGGRNLNDSPAPVAQTQQADHKLVAQKGTAVGDLQYLDKNSDLLSDFDALDELGADNTDQPVNY